MGLISRIFGSKSAPEKLLDAGIRGLDALVYTQEEKAADHAKLAANFLELQKVLGAESSVRSITRRYIAVGVIVVFLFLVLLAVAVYPFDREYANFVLGIISGVFAALVGAIMIFYFGPHMIGRAFGKTK